MAQSIENKVLEHLKYRQRGKIYFTNDFATLGTSESIRKSLSNLVKKDILNWLIKQKGESYGKEIKNRQIPKTAGTD